MYVADQVIFGKAFGFRYHFLGNVDRSNAMRSGPAGIASEIPEAATEIQNRLARQVWQQGVKRGNLKGSIQACVVLPKLLVAIEEDRIIIDVLWAMAALDAHSKNLADEN
ncbi:hypothetical protein NHU_02307 [Rhodovulum sulfidophilum]|uniref:Uncharacterized protein n=1 Tax=Rhodovulum sulfidophilum TaxID=35806 RepID=A0A0D6B422_RHOSU|nr:hypothetical protein NHU_02307 [Rhodovulum sulfidophilum]